MLIGGREPGGFKAAFVNDEGQGGWGDISKSLTWEQSAGSGFPKYSLTHATTNNNNACVHFCISAVLTKRWTGSPWDASTRTKHFLLVNHPREGQLPPHFLFSDVCFISRTRASVSFSTHESLLNDSLGLLCLSRLISQEILSLFFSFQFICNLVLIGIIVRKCYGTEREAICLVCVRDSTGVSGEAAGLGGSSFLPSERISTYFPPILLHF